MSDLHPIAYVALGVAFGGIVFVVLGIGYVVAGARHMAEVDEGDAFGGEYE